MITSTLEILNTDMDCTVTFIYLEGSPVFTVEWEGYNVEPSKREFPVSFAQDVARFFSTYIQEDNG